MAGRKALPDKIKAAKGTLRKHRQSTIQHSPRPIEALDWLQDEAIPILESLCAELEKIGLNSSTYGIIANLAASRIYEIERYSATVARDGAVLNCKRHPLIPAINEAQRHLQSLCSELGLTGQASARLKRSQSGSDGSEFGAL